MALEGVSHASFMDSAMIPSFVSSNDLRADIEEEDGYLMIS